MYGILLPNMETIFAKIINHEIPADIVYEDAAVLAFLDISPINPGHTLVIPKKYFMNIFDGDATTLAHMMTVGQKIAQALVQTGLAEGVNLIMNNGEAAGQEVWHSHLHVIPRLSGDESFTKPKHAECSPEEFSVIKAKLAASLK